MNDKGMSFVELLFSVVIFTLVLSATIHVYAMAATMFTTSQAESKLYTEGRNIIEMIQGGIQSRYGLMKARSNSIAVAADQKSVTFSVDENAAYTSSTADDIPMSVAYSNGDGNDTTYDDNTVIIDPNTTVPNNSFALGSNVASLSFTLNGDLLTVALSMADKIRGSTVKINLTRDIWVRN